MVDGDDGRGSAYDSPHKRAHGREPGRPRDEEPSHGGVGHVRRRREYGDFVDVAALGAVTTKGVSLAGWEGNASPRIAETPSGMLNSIGLQNPGVAHLKECDLPWLEERGATVIVNVSGHSFDEYVQVIEALEDAPVDAYEVNISCPNVDAGGMTIGTCTSSVEEVVSRCRAATKRPLIVKLTPNVTDVAEIARAAAAAGADALSLINTLLGMAIDAERRRPQLARGVGGLSGPRRQARGAAHGMGGAPGGRRAAARHGRHLERDRCGGVHAGGGHGRGRRHREFS